jgi:hypothetical protein
MLAGQPLTEQRQRGILALDFQHHPFRRIRHPAGQTLFQGQPVDKRPRIPPPEPDR